MIENSQNKPQLGRAFRVILLFLLVSVEDRERSRNAIRYISPWTGERSPQKKGRRKKTTSEKMVSQSYLGENKFGSSFSICMYISKHVGGFLLSFFSFPPPPSVRSHSHTEISSGRGRDPEMI